MYQIEAGLPGGTSRAMTRCTTEEVLGQGFTGSWLALNKDQVWGHGFRQEVPSSASLSGPDSASPHWVADSKHGTSMTCGNMLRMRRREASPVSALVAEHGFAVDPAHQAAADKNGHLRKVGGNYIGEDCTGDGNMHGLQAGIRQHCVCLQLVRVEVALPPKA